MRRIIVMWLCSLLLLNIFGMIIPINTSAYNAHNPIYINGNENFTVENGIAGGSGTKSNPYIIEGWYISALSINGIEIHNTTAYFIIRNCYVHDGRRNFNDGICFYNVQNGWIENTISSNNMYGISLSDSSNNLISNNSASNNYEYHYGYGIYIDSSSNNLISNNSALNHRYGIYIDGSSNNTISNNSASSNIYGIHLSSGSGNNLISNNNASNNDYGIYLSSGSSSNLISNNSVLNSFEGIYLDHSKYNTISNNTANSIKGYGICLGHSSNNNVSNNKVLNSEGGIRLYSSSYNSFVSNNISYNSCSVMINSNCKNNTFHHNNFINCIVLNVTDSGVNTKWDDGNGEGNYWSNYIGLDDGSNGRVAGDGVGDTNIPHMGLDNYPLTESMLIDKNPWEWSIALLISIVLIIVVFVVIVVISRRKK